MHATITNDRIEATLDGRTFGSAVLGNDTFEQDIPEAFRSLSLDLQGHSKLLTLEDTDDLSRDTVVDAYRADIKLLGDRLSALEECVSLAIHCSIRSRHRGGQFDVRGDNSELEVHRLWQELQQEVPPMGRQSLLRLDSELAARQPMDILNTLRQQFRASVRRIPQLFTCWLQLLVEKELIGLVEWTDIDVGVGHYHYFKRARQEDTLNQDLISDSFERDPSQPFGSRNTYRTVIEKTVHVRHFLERHVHHIVHGRTNSLEDYEHKVPTYVADLINGLPSLMRPLCKIVSGAITHEEVVRRVTKDEVSVVRDESTWKGSPAVVIGPFVLAGWSSDDMRGETRHFAGQKVQEKVKECEQQEWKLSARIAIATMVSVMAFLAFIIWWTIRSHDLASAVAQREHDAYKASIPGIRVLEATQFEPLLLQGDSEPVLFGQARRLYPHNMWKITLQRGAEPEKLVYNYSFEVPNHSYVGAYGDIDLLPKLGVPATLHVLSIKDGRNMNDPDTLQYAITYRGTK